MHAVVYSSAYFKHGKNRYKSIANEWINEHYREP